jgi:hypothetical protein
MGVSQAVPSQSIGIGPGDCGEVTAGPAHRVF